MEIAFTIPAIPVAQPRQRVTVGTDGKPRTYTPVRHPVNAFKAAAQLAAAKAMNVRMVEPQPLSGPVILAVRFILPRPKNMRWKKKPMPQVRHVKKPDLDNLLKSLKDALSGLVWNNDAQVYSLDAVKVIAAGNESPRCCVNITEIPEQL